MLNGLLLPSGNDAAIALAQRVSGTVAALRGADERARARDGPDLHALHVARRLRRPRQPLVRGRPRGAGARRPRQPRLARIVRRRQAVLPFPIKGGKLYLFNNNPLLRHGYPGRDRGQDRLHGRRRALPRRGRRGAGGASASCCCTRPTPARRPQAAGPRLPRSRADRVVEGRDVPALSPAVYRRRRIVALALGIAVLGRRACSYAAAATTRPAGRRAAAAPRPPQLPGGGRPAPGPPDRRVLRRSAGAVRRAGDRHARGRRGGWRGRRAATSAGPAGAAGDGADRGRGGRAPGPGDRYHAPARRGIDRYLRAARGQGAADPRHPAGPLGLLHRDGAAAQWLERARRRLALDPEWRMWPGQVPGTEIGAVGAREVNATSAWLAQLVKQHNLPEKLFLIHQFTNDMVDDAAAAGAPGALDGPERRRLRRRRRSRRRSTTAFTRSPPRSSTAASSSSTVRTPT